MTRRVRTSALPAMCSSSLCYVVVLVVALLLLLLLLLLFLSYVFPLIGP